MNFCAPIEIYSMRALRKRELYRTFPPAFWRTIRRHELCQTIPGTNLPFVSKESSSFSASSRVTTTKPDVGSGRVPRHRRERGTSKLLCVPVPKGTASHTAFGARIARISATIFPFGDVAREMIQVRIAIDHAAAFSRAVRRTNRRTRPAPKDALPKIIETGRVGPARPRSCRRANMTPGALLRRAL